MAKNKEAAGTEDNSRGVVITFEGIEGCGKGTQVAILAERLKKEGFPVSILKYYEPGGTPLADHIRAILKQNIDKPGQQSLVSIGALLATYEMDPLTQAFLFFAARAHQFHFKLKKEIEEGKIVILDRSVDSTIVYQGYAQDPSLIPLLRANNNACLSANGIRIAKTIILDISVEVAMSRIADRKKFDRFDSQKREFFEKLRDGYMAEVTFSNSDKLSAQRKKYGEEKGRIIAIDGTRTPEKIAQEIYEIVLPLIASTTKLPQLGSFVKK